MRQEGVGMLENWHGGNSRYLQHKLTDLCADCKSQTVSCGDCFTNDYENSRKMYDCIAEGTGLQKKRHTQGMDLHKA